MFDVCGWNFLQTKQNQKNINQTLTLNTDET